MIKRYEGVLRMQGNPMRPFIDDIDLIDDLLETFGARYREKVQRPGVTIMIADKRFTGDLHLEEGIEGYSEYTPGVSPIFELGQHYLMNRLWDLDEQYILLIVADEPVNTLDPPPSWSQTDTAP